MAGCLDTVRMPNMEWLEVGNRRNLVASIAAGVLVSEPEKKSSKRKVLKNTLTILVFLRLVASH